MVSSALALRLGLVLALLDPFVHLDRQVQEALQSVRPSPLDPMMQIATDIGRPQVVLGVLLAVAISGVPAGPTTARNAILALLPTNLVVEGLKRGVNRERPDGERKRSNASFPSSHAANAFALAAVFSRRWPKLSLVFLAFATLVAFSRIFLNRHFLSDVVVGAAVGVGCSWLASRYFRWPGLKRPQATASKEAS
jgi:membrane-associated phospholipid phosphatase